MIRFDDADKNKYYFFIYLTNDVDGEHVHSWSELQRANFSHDPLGSDEFVAIRYWDGKFFYWLERDDLFLFDDIDELVEFWSTIEKVDDRVIGKNLVLIDGSLPRDSKEKVYIEVEVAR